jgi:serine/threonine-protein kinase
VAEVAENTVVDGRYRITGRIGTGGMADVYCAHDEHLGRDVALKMLHRRFAQDHEFVERFRREASAAAGLQHPNVVGVYDRGEYDGTYYIAMEFLRGRTLKDLITQDAPLDQERALDITVQILRAAGFGHRRGVIHRDFKPQNVIVDDEDRVKVTDFGIARAGASEITETGSIMGTAQYLSPEQAQGTAAENASDLYSIGVMLYEMIGGALPFTGDSAVAIALRHLTETPPPLQRLRPDTHPALEAVVMQALAKDPRQRFQDADGFIAALEHVRPQLRALPPGPEDTAVFAPLPPPLAPADDWAALGPPPPPPGPRGPRRPWLWALLGLLAAAIVLGGVLLVQQAGKTPVPGVIGSPVDRARTLLEQRGFAVNVVREPSLQAVDEVITQSPAAGAKAKKGSTVALTVSDGPPSKVVPSVDGLPLKQAIAKLGEKGFNVQIDQQSSDTVPKGTVISTAPPGGTLTPADTRIRVIVSSGVEQVPVPNVIDLDKDTARTTLQDKGFLPVVQEKASPKPPGTVVEQLPPAGTKLAKGERVTIFVSKGPDTAAVPDTVGLSEAEARAQLEGAGFKVQSRTRAVPDQADNGLVVDQRPGSGAQLKKGRTVIIWVGQYTPPSTDTTPIPTVPSGTG